MSGRGPGYLGTFYGWPDWLLQGGGVDGTDRQKCLQGLVSSGYGRAKSLTDIKREPRG
jgi:hypothetical protein